MFNIAVLASTNGTDLQAIIDELEKGNLPEINLKIVVSNKKSAYALERARQQGYKTQFVSSKNKTREEYDLELLEILNNEKIDLVCLVGYMRILSSKFIQEFSGRIINVHPSLIPKYCGKYFYGSNVHQAVLDSGDKETGMTIHFVDEGVDTGEIIVQKKCEVKENDTVESLKEKVQALEKEWYPKVILKLSQNLGKKIKR